MQLTCADVEDVQTRRRTRQEIFLKEMDFPSQSGELLLLLEMKIDRKRTIAAAKMYRSVKRFAL